MLNLSDIIEMCVVPTDRKVRIKDFPTDWERDSKISGAERRREAKRLLIENVQQLSESQEILYASQTWAVLVILQAMDAAGKDSTVEHVMKGVNPQGVDVTSFKQPSSEELSHNFLWRCSKALPPKGRIGIFNRSYYEEVLVVKVHPEFVANQRIPGADPRKKSFWKGRYKDINQFEKHLSRNGTKVIKFFLNLSKDEQKRRFLSRIDDLKKNWKFSANDLVERAKWDVYMKAYEEMLNATNTKHAPWYVVPADDKSIARLLVSQILSKLIDNLGLKLPELAVEQRDSLIECKAKLEAETD